MLAGMDPWMCVEDSPAAKSCAAYKEQEDDFSFYAKHEFSAKK